MRKGELKFLPSFFVYSDYIRKFAACKNLKLNDMKKLTFKRIYAIILLIVFIVYGWLYLKENRYKQINDSYAMFDTWTSTFQSAENFLEE